MKTQKVSARIENGQLIIEDDDCCGSWLFQTGKGDVFHKACVYHDVAYQYHKVRNLQTRKEIDDIFLFKMLDAAGHNRALIVKARAYYRLVRMFGWIAWSDKANAL